MRSVATAMLAGGLLVLASGTAGFLLGRESRVVLEAAGSPVETRVVEPDFAPVLDELQRVKADILRGLPEVRRSEPASATREPVQADDRLDRIASTVDGIAKRLDEEIQLQGRGRGFASLDAILQKFRMLEAGLESAESIRADLRAAHVRWAHRDLLERYGRPGSDSWNSVSGVTTYDLGPAWVSFSTTNDEVWEVGLSAKQ